jgi:hypothetical protein
MRATLTAAEQSTSGDLGGGHNGDLLVQLTGEFVATVSFEATVDGANFVPVAATPLAGGASVTSAAGPGAWRIRAGGLLVRARCSAFTSGAVKVTSRPASE